MMVVDYGLSPPRVEQTVGHHGGSGGRGGSSDSDREPQLLRGCECDSKALMVLLEGVRYSAQCRCGELQASGILSCALVRLQCAKGLSRRRKHTGQRRC